MNVLEEIKAICSEIQAMISEANEPTVEAEKEKQLIALIALNFNKLLDLQKQISDQKGPEIDKVSKEIEDLRKKFIHLQTKDSEESESESIERQEIDLPDDVRSNGSSLLETNEDEIEKHEQHSSQSDFLQSLIIAVGFCLLFAIIWSYFT